jgi:type II secretory pathway predicted ATPase ExeA
MIKSTFGLTHEPFRRSDAPLLPQQQRIFEILRIHAQHGGFCVVLGTPGVGKSVLREQLERLAQAGDTVVVSCSRTLHTYPNLLRQLAHSLQVQAPDKQLEYELIQVAFGHVRERRSLYTLIDEAHLLDMGALRRLRLLFERFPKKHNLVLFGQPELLHHLSLLPNADIKSRITFSQTLLPLNDADLRAWVVAEMEAVRLPVTTFDQGAVEVILRAAQGNLRLCCNLCHGSLIEACRAGKRVVSIGHVNDVLIQPHWRSHEQLIQQQASQP